MHRVGCALAPVASETIEIDNEHVDSAPSRAPALMPACAAYVAESPHTRHALSDVSVREAGLPIMSGSRQVRTRRALQSGRGDRLGGPPVETSSIPVAASARSKSISPDLSETTGGRG